MNDLNPLISGINSFYGFRDGQNIYGENISKTQAGLYALGAVPPLKIGGVLAKGGMNLLKFGGDEAAIHFGKHASQIMKITGKSAYNLKNYVGDANWIIQNGTYSSKLNGYYHYMGNAAKGESLFGFVGLKNGGSTISTFHIKTATQLGLK